MRRESAIQSCVLALALGALAAFALPTITAAETKKTPTQTDPCAGSKAKSACKNEQAVRSLLRESPPPSKKPAGAGTPAGSAKN